MAERQFDDSYHVLRKKFSSNANSIIMIYQNLGRQNRKKIAPILAIAAALMRR
jgi:hypothetical protein